MNSRFLQQLTAQSRLADLAADRVRRVQLETGERLAPVLLKLGLLSETDLADEMVRFSGRRRIEANVSIQRIEVTDFAVPDAFLNAHELVPVAQDDASITVACWDALDEYAVRALAFACEKPVHWVMATQSQVRNALEAHQPKASLVHDASPTASAVEDEEVERLKDLASEAPVIRLVQRIIGDVDWRDADDLTGEQGAERNEYRLAGRAQGPRNGPFETVSEVQQVLGGERIDAELLEVFTVYSQSQQVNQELARARVVNALQWAQRQQLGGRTWWGNITSSTGIKQYSSLTGEVLRLQACTSTRSRTCRVAIVRLTGNRSDPMMIYSWR